MKKNAQSLIEYGLILALVAVVAVTVMGKLGGSISKAGTNASTSVDNASKNALDEMCRGMTYTDANANNAVKSYTGSDGNGGCSK